jgi:hypothetical protein
VTADPQLLEAAGWGEPGRLLQELLCGEHVPAPQNLHACPGVAGPQVDLIHKDTTQGVASEVR